MQADLNGKVAFVCGSTSGIGKAIAVKLAKNGADIVLNGRTEASAKGPINEIKQLGRKLIFECADITEYSSIKKGVEHALAELGQIDIMVASGGIVGSGLMADFFDNTDVESYSAWTKWWFGRLYPVRAVLDHMIQRKKGKIVFISADAGRISTPAECLPGSMTAAMNMSTKVLAQELARYQIRVNTLCLAPMEGTPSYHYAIELSKGLDHVFQKVWAKQPFRVTAEDVAEAALFFCCDESNAITGQLLSINGGLSFPG